MKNDTVRVFIDEIYSDALKKTYPTNKTIFNHFDEKWNFELMTCHEISNNNGFRYKFVIIENFSK